MELRVQTEQISWDNERDTEEIRVIPKQNESIAYITQVF